MSKEDKFKNYNNQRAQSLVFAALITMRRASLGLSQDDVAKKSGITRATINTVESGKGNSSMLTCMSILEALDLKLSDFGELFQIAGDFAGKTNPTKDEK
jgi:DNA-binding XRE family transcriptional regulator